MEDDLNNNNNEDDIAEAYSPAAEASIAITPPTQPIPLQRQGPRPEWCICGNCCNMPLEVEKVCCTRKKKTVTQTKNKIQKTVFGPRLS